jgi:hypothetical protein
LRGGGPNTWPEQQQPPPPCLVCLSRAVCARVWLSSWGRRGVTLIASSVGSYRPGSSAVTHSLPASCPQQYTSLRDRTAGSTAVPVHLWLLLPDVCEDKNHDKSGGAGTPGAEIRRILVVWGWWRSTARAPDHGRESKSKAKRERSGSLTTHTRRRASDQAPPPPPSANPKPVGISLAPRPRPRPPVDRIGFGRRHRAPDRSIDRSHHRVISLDGVFVHVCRWRADAASTGRGPPVRTFTVDLQMASKHAHTHTRLGGRLVCC